MSRNKSTHTYHIPIGSKFGQLTFELPNGGEADDDEGVDYCRFIGFLSGLTREWSAMKIRSQGSAKRDYEDTSIIQPHEASTGTTTDAGLAAEAENGRETEVDLEGSDEIRIRLRDSANESDTIHYTIRHDSDFQKALMVFAEYYGKRAASLRMSYAGKRIESHHTPGLLSMFDDDIVDVATQRVDSLARIEAGIQEIATSTSRVWWADVVAMTVGGIVIVFVFAAIVVGKEGH